MHLKTSNGVRPTSRAELVRLVRDIGVAPASRVVSTDGGATWRSIDSVIGVEVDAIDEAALAGATLTSFAMEPIEPHAPAAARVRRGTLLLFVIAFFAAFTPWLWIRAAENDETLTAAPFGFSLWWGSLCVLASGLGVIAMAVDLSLPRVRRVRELARWIVMAGALACLVLPLVGFAMAWAGAGLPEPLQFLYDIRHNISLIVAPLGLVIEVVVAAMATFTARVIWSERSRVVSQPHVTPQPLAVAAPPSGPTSVVSPAHAGASAVGSP